MSDQYVPKPGDVVRVRGTANEPWVVEEVFQPPPQYRIRSLNRASSWRKEAQDLTQITPDEWEKIAK